MKRWDGGVDHLMHNDDARITLAPHAKDNDKGIAGFMLELKKCLKYVPENESENGILMLRLCSIPRSGVIKLSCSTPWHLGWPFHHQDLSVNFPRILSRSCL